MCVCASYGLVMPLASRAHADNAYMLPAKMLLLPKDAVCTAAGLSSRYTRSEYKVHIADSAHSAPFATNLAPRF